MAMQTDALSDIKTRRLGIALVGGAFALISVAGLMLWFVRGEAVFMDMVSAAIAWCF